MRMWASQVLAIAVLLCAGGLTVEPLAAQTAPSPCVLIKDDGGALQITIDGAPFTTYRYTKQADDPAWDRPYFYPVLAQDGTPVTSDQWRLIQKEHSDHPWHRSVWVGWGNVNGLDHWRLKEKQQR